MQITHRLLPTHWASVLINSDYSGVEDYDIAAIEEFTSDMVKQYGQCWCLDVQDDHEFAKYHDAERYGVLAADCATFVFDITKRD